MKHSIVETLVGLLVLLIALAFLVFAYNASNVSKTRDGYSVIANFQDIDGISKGADVKLAGIKIGYVDQVTLDPNSFSAGVRLFVDNNVEIPEDSRAIVATTGLLGGKYIRITPGGSEANLKNEGKIKFTQSALNIEDLIGKLMYSLTSK
jgi:phospholipid/cholesterol/gamma-HCH transport system substrate-binding protein